MSSKRKTPTACIVAAPPLSTSKKVRGARVCNLCAEPAGMGALRLYRECDEHDNPLPDERALLFVAADHRSCMARVDENPRLYVELRGAPGTFPKLCGSCIHRQGFACTHPKAKINGGEGLNLGLDPIAAMVVCVRATGCQRPLAHVLGCEGQELPGEREAAGAGAAS